MKHLKDIRTNLLEYKDKNNLTYEDLGKLIGVSKSVAWDICNKRRRFLDIVVVGKILQLLGV